MSLLMVSSPFGRPVILLMRAASRLDEASQMKTLLEASIISASSPAVSLRATMAKERRRQLGKNANLSYDNRELTGDGHAVERLNVDGSLAREVT